MSRTKRRLEQIKQSVEITQILSDYGYKVHLGGNTQEQQFPCDLHGDGNDGKPSARVYPATGQWYCFACSKSRDAVETVRAKENLGFMEALSFIEAKYELPQVPWEEGDRQESESGPKAVSVAGILDATKTFADDRVQYVAVLQALTEDRLLAMDTLLAHWEALDKVAYQVDQKTLPEASGRLLLAKLHERLLDAMGQKYRHDPSRIQD